MVLDGKGTKTACSVMIAMISKQKAKKQEYKNELRANDC
jgi:hypothetical protein